MEIVYYTSNKLDSIIFEAVQQQLLRSNLPIVSVSLKPIRFGRNIIVEETPSILTMYKQILIGAESSSSDVIFLCEHDVLYHPSHFDFKPSRMDTYYYNVNVWRWAYLQDWFITYDTIASLSGLCAPRDMVINYYKTKLQYAEEHNLENGRNPGWARKLGHEPGKSRRRGGLLDEKMDTWKSKYPNIDIRHGRNLTPQKMTLDSFRRQPAGWREGTFKDITGWERERVWIGPEYQTRRESTG